MQVDEDTTTSEAAPAAIRACEEQLGKHDARVARLQAVQASLESLLIEGQADFYPLSPEAIFYVRTSRPLHNGGKTAAAQLRADLGEFLPFVRAALLVLDTPTASDKRTAFVETSLAPGSATIAVSSLGGAPASADGTLMASTGGGDSCRSRVGHANGTTQPSIPATRGMQSLSSDAVLWRHDAAVMSAEDVWS